MITDLDGKQTKLQRSASDFRDNCDGAPNTPSGTTPNGLFRVCFRHNSTKRCVGVSPQMSADELIKNVAGVLPAIAGPLLSRRFILLEDTSGMATPFSSILSSPTDFAGLTFDIGILPPDNSTSAKFAKRINAISKFVKSVVPESVLSSVFAGTGTAILAWRKRW